MEKYKKTGEDKNYEFIRNDLEVDSDDGNGDAYMQILNKRNEFSVKILNKEIKIKKSSINKIMILSNNEPEEQILFSLYKTISKDSMDNLKLKSPNKTLVNIQENKIDLISDDPLSDKINTPFGNNKIHSGLIQTNSIINIQNNNNIDTNLDNENVVFGKPEVNLIGNEIIGLPPEAIRAKWLYFLLATIGSGYIIIFIVGIINKEINLNINIFSKILFIFTFISLLSGITASVLIKINKKTEKYFIVSFIFGIISSVISLICFFLLNILKKNNFINRTKKFERLM